jgi:Tol biopolymer transport system component
LVLPVASAENGKIAFQSSASQPPDGDYSYNIYVINPDGTGLKKLTNDPVFNEETPAWSPDGTKIAFVWNHNYISDIYVMNADGTGLKQLTNDPGYNLEPVWSPDGTKIAYNMNFNQDIYVVKADGTGNTPLTNSKAIYPAWSPDSMKIAFECFPNNDLEICVINADGTEQKRLTNSPGLDGSPVWSPDGTKIAFASERDGDFEIYVMKADGTELTQLTNNVLFRDSNPAWSPYGTKIAFESNRDSILITNNDLYVMNADGTEQKRLTNSLNWDQYPVWSPDGTKIAFESSGTYSNSKIWVINADGTGLTQLTYNPGWDGWVSWGPATNQAPVLDPIGAKTVNEGQTLMLTVSATDVDGDGLTYSATGVPAGATFSGSTFTWTPAYDQAGSYKVTFMVSDGSFTDAEEVTIIVNNVNRVPVAEAGPDQLLQVVGTTVHLSGAQSYDEDGDPLTYQWTLLSKPVGSTAALTGADTATPIFVADKNGAYSVQLVVSDGKDSSAADTVTVSFQNIKPVADAGTSQSLTLGETATLDGSQSSDPNGDTLTYQWSLIAVPAGSVAQIVNSVAVQATFTPDRAGTYTIQLVVNDGLLNSDPSTIQIQVVAKETKIITDIQDLETTITGLPSGAFKNANMQNTLINKLNEVIAAISAGDYTGALNKLQNDILKKTDGCAVSGAPDKNDWITNCKTQGILYPLINSIINELKLL